MAPEIDKINPWETALGSVSMLEDQFLGYALEATDPDPTAPGHVVDPKKRVEEFKSVVELVPKKEPPSVSQGILRLFADGFANRVRSLTTAQLLTRLKELEEKAFRFDPKTKEAPVADEGAYLELKNYLKAIERMAYSDKKYLRQVDQKEIYRLFIIASPDLSSRGRGLIYQVEKEGMNLAEFSEHDSKDFLEFFKSYDGKVRFFEHPILKSSDLITQYANLHWSEKENLQMGKKHVIAHHDEIRKILLKQLPAEVLDIYSKSSVQQIMREALGTSVLMWEEKDPEKKIKLAFANGALTWELALRGIGMQKQLEGMVESLLPVMGEYEKKLSPVLQDELKKGLIAGSKASRTITRLDNYRARETVVQSLATVIKSELMRRESPLHLNLDSPEFDALVGAYISFANNFQIPFQATDVFSIAEGARLAAGVSLGGGKIIRRPISWKEVRQRGTVTVALDAYPRSNDWLENEWDILKKIIYNGVSVYDLARSVIDTVTLAPTITDKQDESSIRLGTSHNLFRNIEIAYLEDGQPIPVYQRLVTAAHEVFHVLDSLRTLNGVLTGGSLEILFERGAEFFGVYVAKEYLKLRLAHQKEKPISKGEAEGILVMIMERLLFGYWSNTPLTLLRKGSLSILDQRVEIPIAIEQAVYDDVLRFDNVGEAEKAMIYAFKLRREEYALSFLKLLLAEKKGQLSPDDRTVIFLSGLTDKREESLAFIRENAKDLVDFMVQETEKICSDIPQLRSITPDLCEGVEVINVLGPVFGVEVEQDK